MRGRSSMGFMQGGRGLAVAYYDTSAEDLIFAYSMNGGATWFKSTVESSDNIGFSPSLYSLNARTHFISYYDVTNSKIRYAKTTNNGASWTKGDVATAAPSGGYATSEIFAIDASNIAINYASGVASTTHQAVSSNGGATWSTPSTHNGDAGSIFGISTSHYIAACARNAAGPFRFNVTTDGGANWTETTPSPGYLAGLNLYALSATSYLAIGNASTNATGNILLWKTTDSGVTWSSTMPFNNAGGGQYTQGTCVFALDANTFYVVYAITQTGVVWFTKTTDAGANWSTRVQVSANGGGTGDFAKMVIHAVSATEIYIAFAPGGGGSVYLAKSTDSGATWSQVTVDSSSTFQSQVGMSAFGELNRVKRS